MKAARWTAALLILGVGCATVGGTGSPGRIRGNDYVNVEQGFGFRIPSGWSQVEPTNPFARPDWVVRFESPGGEAALTGRVADVGSVTCLEAARQLLAERDLRLQSDTPFTITTPSGEDIAAWRANLDGPERGGRTALFCRGGKVVVLEATAANDRLSSYATTLDDSVKSFAYAADPTLVRVAPASTPTPVPLFDHEITFRGQTLGRIAEWYTGDYDNWRKLAEVNDDLTVDDAPLRIGRVVKIPKTLLVRTDPMPRPKPAPRPPAAQPTPTPEAAPEVELPPLMGPR